MSINGYATVGSQTANAAYFDLRLSDGTTVCAKSATTIGKKVVFLPCLATKKRFKTLPLAEIVAVTDEKGNSVQLKQTTANPTDERNKGDKMARTALIAGIIALLTGLGGFLMRIVGTFQNTNFNFNLFGSGGTNSGPTNKGDGSLALGSLLLIGSSILSLVGLITGINSFTWFKKPPTPSQTSSVRATVGAILSGLVLIVLGTVFLL